MKKMVLMGVAAALVTTSLAGGSLAYFSATGREVQQTINTQTLGIQFADGAQHEALGSTSVSVKAVPGKSYEKEMAVTNTETEPLYARVVIQKFWMEDGEKDMELDPTLIDIISDEAGDSWILQSSDDEEIVMYYTRPLEPQESSTFFINEIAISEKAGNAYSGKEIGLEFTTDGVQKFAAEEAILSEWGVVANFENEIITEINE